TGAGGRDPRGTPRPATNDPGSATASGSPGRHRGDHVSSCLAAGWPRRACNGPKEVFVPRPERGDHFCEGDELMASAAVTRGRWHPARLLVAGFEGLELPGELRALVSQGRIGGVILFARNVRDPHQVRRLVRAIREAGPADAPVTVAIDQEGGRVQRLRDPWTEWPPMRRFGELGEVEATRRFARALGRELFDLGIGLDFAPVVDVDTNPANPVIGDRSFGSSADVVAEYGA